MNEPQSIQPVWPIEDQDPASTDAASAETWQADEAYADAYEQPLPAGESLGDLAAAVRATSEKDYIRQPAAFTGRMGATLADMLIQMLISLITLAAALLLGAVLPGFLAVGVGFLLAVGVPVLYSLTEVYGLATPGKSIVGLRIARRDGYPPSSGQRTGRWAIKHSPLLLWVAVLATGVVEVFAGVESVLGPLEVAIPFALLGLCLLVLVSCLMVLLPDRLALHDMLTGTAVFREEDLTRKPRYTGSGFQPVLPVGPERTFDDLTGKL